MRLKFMLTAVLVNLVVLGGGTRLAAQASAAGHAPETPPPDACLVDKHYFRKHGATAYYGQKRP